MNTTFPSDPAKSIKSDKSTRLNYLDWLQVIAILGVFLFHAVHPFDDLYPWHIKNDQSIMLVNFFVGFFGSWGMPFFFLMAGATSWFSLKHRTAGRYLFERVTRLLIPFLVGSFFLTPIQAYFELTHKGLWQDDTFLSFLFSAEARRYFFGNIHQFDFGPSIFGALGYHLWFVGFLFAFSVICTPLFFWLKGKSGARFLTWLSGAAAYRGGLLIFMVLPVISRLILQPYFPDEHNWSDFVFMMLFFISGFIIISQEKFRTAILRDHVLYLILGVVTTLFFFSSAAGVPIFDWMGSPSNPGFYIVWIAVGINSFSWTMYMFFIGMRYLDRKTQLLQYGREASYAFFFIHQPVIIMIAFFVVQWEIQLLIKILIVVIGSFILSLGLYELMVKRIPPLRALFGIKPPLK